MTTDHDDAETYDPTAHGLAVYESLNGHKPDALAAIETGRHFPEWIWATSPRLEHIRTAARARRVGPDAVLAVVLARCAAWSNPDIRLPPIVGDDAAVTLLVDLFGPPSSGKSSAVATARRLVHRPAFIDKQLDGWPIGSGEGLAEALYGEAINDETGKRERALVHRNLFTYADEGEVISALSSRTGSVLMTTLRTVFTAGTLGQGNAAVDKRRIVPALTYAMGVVLATQETRAAQLFADVGGGTPQRFVCAMSTDPDAPDVPPPWPGPLAWEPPAPDAAVRQAWVDNRLVHYFDLTDAIADAIDNKRVDDLRGVIANDPWLAHANLKRLKVAALLAALDGSLVVTDERWMVAGSIVATSDRVIAHARRVITDDEAYRDEVANTRHARRAVRTEAEANAWRVDKAATWVGRHVHRLGAVTNTAARRAATASVRDVWTDAVEVATGRGWLAVEERPNASTNDTTTAWLLPGKARP